jgi:hypothetical protein
MDTEFSMKEFKKMVKPGDTVFYQVVSIPYYKETKKGFSLKKHYRGQWIDITVWVSLAAGIGCFKGALLESWDDITRKLSAVVRNLNFSSLEKKEEKT